MAENQKYLLMNLRIGSGIDFHQLVAGRDLWIGGILIPHHKGALGHSDADVLRRDKKKLYMIKQQRAELTCSTPKE